MSLAILTTPTQTVTLRKAVIDDVGPLVALIARDQLRAAVESTAEADRGPYLKAFEAIDTDPAQLLCVVDSDEGVLVATMQLTFIPGLARAGALRMQIEAVRVDESLRGQGIGAAMMVWAIEEGRRRGAKLVQLTSDNTRLDAHRFYERLGFAKSHAGFKLAL